MRRYEDLDIITLDAYEDITDIIVGIIEKEEPVSLITNMELAEYVLYVILKMDETSILKIDISEKSEHEEYILSVDKDGVITLLPLDDYRLLNADSKFYVDMDGTVDQDIIDELMSLDKNIILFGLEDDGDDDIQEGCSHSVYISKDKNGIPLGFTRNWSITDDNYTEYSSYSVYTNNQKRLDELAEMFDVKL